MIDNNIKILIFLLLQLLSILKLTAQSDQKVALIGQVKEDKIILRWAPNNALAWELAIKYGYTLERHTVLRDSAIISPSEKVLLGNFAPALIQEWENKIDQDDYIAISAQAIYGETFELTEDYSSDIIQIINKTKEQTQRFSFALFAADQSFEAAQMSGLAYVDTQVKENEKYLYKIYANIPKEILELDSGLTYLSIADYAPLTPIKEISVDFSEGMATIQWDQGTYEKVYNSFIVERSEDGGATFQTITKKPIINTYEAGKKQSRYGVKVDSISNNQEYKYRVRGRNAFGEVGPASEPISGLSYSKTSININFSKAEILDANSLLLQWDVADELVPSIEGFNIYKATSANGQYAKVNKQILDASLTSYNESIGVTSAYYTLGVVTQNGENKSMPYLVQLEDTIPPAAPVQLKYAITSEGEVYLSWVANEEDDLLGYRIYRSNFNNSEFSEISTQPILSNSYSDDISIKNLTKNIYYQVRALDTHYNPSDASKTLIVKKPDLVPPTAPVITSYKVNGNNVEIEWQPSSSTDVVAYLLYSREVGEENWLLVDKMESTNKQLNYQIPTINFHNFRITALDDNNNESKSSNIISVKSNSLINAGIKNLKYTFNSKDRSIIITWDIINPEINEIIIYKKTSESDFNVFTTISAASKSFSDKKIEESSGISYALLPKPINGEAFELHKVDVVFR